VSAFLEAVDNVREELRALHEAVARQEELLRSAERREHVLTDVAELLDHIPARVGAAVRGALAEVASARITSAVEVTERVDHAERAGNGDVLLPIAAAPAPAPAPAQATSTPPSPPPPSPGPTSAPPQPPAPDIRDSA
jgi:hypothetical protein